MLQPSRRALLTATLLLAGAAACSKRETVTSIDQLATKEFAVPTGTAADQLVSSRFAGARFVYVPTVLDAALAVKTSKADAAAYDEPILRNIAAKYPELVVLPDRITTDEYGFAVRLGDTTVKQAVDAVVRDARASGDYQRMIDRWLPATGAPQPMPEIATPGTEVLRFGTAAVTEPFSFIDGSQKVVGLDVEIAARTAARLGKRLEVVNMEFGALIPALISGKVDMIGACITITAERRKAVLFSESYYTGGISALVRKP